MQNVERVEQALCGIRVIELGIWIQGPLAAQTLGDLGASVIKIERPNGGDYTRGLTSLYGVPLKGDDTGGLLWQLCNRNKRSVAIDLSKSGGQELLLKLVESADVFVTNLQPPALRRCGATPELLMGANPKLIYALGGGLAVEGDLAELACQDTTAMAFSGFMLAVADGGGSPCYPPGAMIDVLAANNLVSSVVCALYRRQSTGVGELVSTSLLHSALWLQMLNVGTIENQHVAMRPFDRRKVTNPLMNLYRCGDGKWLALGMLIASSAGWKALCEKLGEPSLSDDNRFDSNRNRASNSRELVEILDDLFSRLTRDEFVAAMKDADLPCTPVNSVDDTLLTPAVMDQELVRQTEQGTRFLRPPMNLDGPVHAQRDAPALGSATFEVFREVGLEEDHITSLIEEGVIC